ncbi:hypothetical protein [Tumebacillus flagellatus]|uniref:Uncharacterized protein n=1 Tax=Tumebacillus flagellatus TaxID=1157490 RepID=A0A074LP63_9BACL|nr:hypothetical protein [Tumebacillus flagellatus]KEO83956.1 hypothetical protein EL26_07135 [Tumebacillus flagellatus]
MRFSRSELIEIITPHVLRTLIRLHGAKGAQVAEQDLIDAGLTEEQRRALVQTKRLLPTETEGVYQVNLQA